jgi:hypothetical protein
VEPLARLTTVRQAGPSAASRTTTWVAGVRGWAFVRIMLIPSAGRLMRRISSPSRGFAATTASV